MARTLRPLAAAALLAGLACLAAARPAFAAPPPGTGAERSAPAARRLAAPRPVALERADLPAGPCARPVRVERGDLARRAPHRAPPAGARELLADLPPARSAALASDAPTLRRRAARVESARAPPAA